MVCGKLNTFKEINSMAKKGGIVFLGADYFASLPVSELASVFNLDERIFNRSICGTTVNNINEMLDDCIFALQPCKIFINLGETELKSGMDVKDFLSAYEWLLYSIHSKTAADIYVVSVMSENENVETYNSSLRHLCSEVGCKFIDVTPALKCTKPNLHVFDMLKYYVHSHTLDFADIMSMR